MNILAVVSTGVLLFLVSTASGQARPEPRQKDMRSAPGHPGWSVDATHTTRRCPHVHPTRLPSAAACFDKPTVIRVATSFGGISPDGYRRRRCSTGAVGQGISSNARARYRAINVG
jgi:hypothetical protein